MKRRNETACMCEREINKRMCERKRERERKVVRESEIDVEFSRKRKSDVTGFGGIKKLSLCFKF